MLSAFSLSALIFHPGDTTGTLELGTAFVTALGAAENAQSGPGAHVLLAVVGSVPAPRGWAPRRTADRQRAAEQLPPDGLIQ